MAQKPRSFFPIPRHMRRPMEELKRLYRSSQFSSELGFENPYDWLALERRCDAPNMDLWSTLMVKTNGAVVFRGREAEVLRRGCDAFDMKQYGARQAIDEFLVSILSALDPYRATVFLGSADPIVLLQHPGGACRIVSNPDRIGILAEPATPSEIFDIVLTTWNKGGPKSVRAREFAHEAGELAIAELEVGFFQDFDSSVAVSWDGSMIAQADRVVIFDNASVARIYSANRFQANKLDLDQSFDPTILEIQGNTLDVLRIRRPQKMLPIRAYLAALRSLPTAPQGLIRTTDDQKLIFVTHVAATGDSTLPDQGVLVP